MFERLAERARRAAERRVEAKIVEMVEVVAPQLPSGIAAEAAPEGVRLSGRALGRRFALEPALRWMQLR